MKKIIQITATPQELYNDSSVKEYIQKFLGVLESDITGFKYQKKSIDARKKPVKINLQLEVFLNQEVDEDLFDFDFKNVDNAKEVTIIGAGPAGLFAALKLIELGLKPIIFERGKEVRDRRRDLANITKNNTVNTESNYCYGEGGAGTYSDGKLYTRSSKRGDVMRVLKLLVKHGAHSNILYESHPHIGTNKLPQIITNIRETILACGGQIFFNSKLVDVDIKNNQLKGIKIIQNNTQTIPHKTEHLILATGHSARDIFELLDRKKILIEAKPFALGVRIEHEQKLIDSIQYKCNGERSQYLPASSYSLVQQINGRGVFSFCMCPGGIIAPAMTNENEIVVNGWSPSKRNNPFANSGMVVSVELSDLKQYTKYGPLAAMKFQADVERNCFNSAQKDLKAPAQRVVDFVNKKHSQNLPQCSYLPGLVSKNLNDVLPEFVHKSIRGALQEFGKKMKGYYTNDAVLVAVESRTSSPVRIPRDRETHEHIQIKGLYPSAEGAGYAGGIVSAAMDGENCANAIAKSIIK